MTTIDGESLAPTAATSAVPARGSPRRALGDAARAFRAPERRIFVLPAVAAVLGLAAGAAALFDNNVDSLALPAIGLLLLGSLAAVAVVRRRTGAWDGGGFLVAAVACLVAAAGLTLLPEYTFGGQLNGVIHRSAISAPILLVLSALVASRAIRGLLGDGPAARDASLYPWLTLPVALALVGYAMLLSRILIPGVAGFNLDLLTSAWGQQLVGQPGSESFVYQTGLRNHVLGTLLLMGLTLLFSILPGIGAGVFLSEYPGPIATIVGFCTTILRAMSVFIIGVAAVTLVGAMTGWDAASIPSQLIRGAVVGNAGQMEPLGGSFILAGAALSVLVIPIIAKLTEEGLRSIPTDIREGTVALGATEGYGLRRILLPWAAPNIITGLLLGAAEAAGSLAIIMFIAGNGDYGVGPLTEVTSLDFALFSTRYGTQPFIQTMGYRAPTDYAYTAALLLLVITLGLTIGAIWLRGWAARRARGTLTTD